VKLLGGLILVMMLAAGDCAPQAPIPGPTIKMAEYLQPYEDRFRSQRMWVECENLDIVIETLDEFVEDEFERGRYPVVEVRDLLQKKVYLLWLRKNVCLAV